MRNDQSWACVCSQFLYGESISRHPSHTSRHAFPTISVWEGRRELDNKTAISKNADEIIWSRKVSSWSSSWSWDPCHLIIENDLINIIIHPDRHRWIRDGLALMLFWLSLRPWQLYLLRKMELRKHFVFYFCTSLCSCFCNNWTFPCTCTLLYFLSFVFYL